MYPGDVRVELIDLDARAPDRSSSESEEALDASERTRAAALRDPADRLRYVASHVALRRLLGEATGVRPGAVVILRSSCVSCGEPHGKPYLDDGPAFSFTRSGRWAAVALSTAATVGVDIERAQDHARLAPLADTLLAPGEEPHDLLRTWVRKEALLKATGEGLTRAMTGVRADDDRVHDLSLPEGLVGALAVFTDGSSPSAKVRRR